MANIKSAKKRIDTINRRREENKFVKATLSTYVKNYRKALAEGRISDAEAKLPEIIAYIDSACTKGVIHKNNASRRVGRLNAALFKAKTTAPAEVAPAKKTKKAEAKVEETVETTEVVAEEKPAKAKKTTAKKTEKVEKEKKTTTKKAKKVEE